MKHTKQIKLAIQTSWESLLETIDEARATLGQEAGPEVVRLVAKLETLQASLRGLGLAWQEIWFIREIRVGLWLKGDRKQNLGNGNRPSCFRSAVCARCSRPSPLGRTGGKAAKIPAVLRAGSLSNTAAECRGYVRPRVACARCSRPTPLGRRAAQPRRNTNFPGEPEISNLLPEDTPEDAGESDVAGALPESAYWKPLARTLLDLGGSAKTADAINAVEERMASLLQPVDRARVPSGSVRWDVRVRFARERLKKHGLINDKSLRGMWELTPAGVRWAESDGIELPAPVPPENPDQRELPF